MTVWILFVVILSCSGVQSVMDYVDVEVEQGVLRGAVEFTDNNTMFYRFSGVPYAEPPIGSLRFKVSLFTIFKLNKIMNKHLVILIKNLDILLYVYIHTYIHK